jgi:hypothetical protein
MLCWQIGKEQKLAPHAIHGTLPFFLELRLEQPLLLRSLRRLESLLLLPHFEVGSGIELCGQQRGELRVHSVVSQILLVPVESPPWPPHVRELDAELEQKTHHFRIPAAAGVDDRLVLELMKSHLRVQIYPVRLEQDQERPSPLRRKTAQDCR